MKAAKATGPLAKPGESEPSSGCGQQAGGTKSCQPVPRLFLFQGRAQTLNHTPEHRGRRGQSWLPSMVMARSYFQSYKCASESHTHSMHDPGTCGFAGVSAHGPELQITQKGAEESSEGCMKGLEMLDIEPELRVTVALGTWVRWLPAKMVFLSSKGKGGSTEEHDQLRCIWRREMASQQ